MASESYKIAIY